MPTASAIPLASVVVAHACVLVWLAKRLTTGPVPEFLVDDLPAALEELRAAGIEILGTPEISGREGWLQFRAPDGNVYGLTAASSYWRSGSTG